ncbi:MAG: hypothetical protein IJE78_04935 [Bacteroidaceae bacterium]|nr:hypothetical protein [Bacteroidaceae bacterium]
MTVSEMIQELQQFDPNMDICVQVGSRSYRPIDVYFEPETVWNRLGDTRRDVLMMRGI